MTVAPKFRMTGAQAQHMPFYLRIPFDYHPMHSWRNRGVVRVRRAQGSRR
jgi:hypothetical protein